MNAQSSTMVLATVGAFVLPLSLSFWIMSVIGASPSEVSDLPSPVRWLASITIPTVIAFMGVQRKSLDFSGALMALVIGFTLTLSNYCFMVSLLIFYFSSSKATKVGSQMKRKFESRYKEGGQRDWVQVICNGGVPAVLAFLFFLERGIGGETAINFIHDYNASWFSIAVLGAIACCNGDTWASELGSVWSSSDPFLITSFTRVPRGTNGGVSVIGLLVSILGGLSVGIGFYVSLILTVNREVLALSPPQWPIMMTGALAGLLGSVIDSLLGATFQYSGRDTVTGKIVETPGERVKWISGVGLFDNHSVNFLSTLITAAMTPKIAMYLLSYCEPL